MAQIAEPKEFYWRVPNLPATHLFFASNTEWFLTNLTRNKQSVATTPLNKTMIRSCDISIHNHYNVTMMLHTKRTYNTAKTHKHDTATTSLHMNIIQLQHDKTTTSLHMNMNEYMSPLSSHLHSFTA